MVSHYWMTTGECIRGSFLNGLISVLFGLVDYNIYIYNIHYIHYMYVYIYIHIHILCIYIYIICDSAILLVLYVIFPLFLVGTCTATRRGVFSSSFKAHLLRAHEDLIIAMRRLQKCRGYDQLSSGC
jgi:hypothetical protein